MADARPIATPPRHELHPLVLAGNRLHPILRPILYVFLVPPLSITCGIGSEVRLGGYGKIYPGAVAANLALSLLMVRYVDRRSLRSFGLAGGWLAVRDAAIGLLIPALQLALIFGIERAMGWIRVVSFAWDGEILKLALMRWTFVASVEELMARGYFFQSLVRLGGRRFGAALALVVTSYFFGSAHAGNPNASAFAVASLAISGLEYGVAYLVTGRLWMPIAMHFAWNLVQGTVLGFPVSGMPRPSFLVISQGGPDAWTGGAFGPEAGYLSPALSLVDVGVLCGLARLGFWRPEAGPVEAEAAASSPAVPDAGGIAFLDGEGTSRPDDGLADEQSRDRDAGSGAEMQLEGE